MKRYQYILLDWDGNIAQTIHIWVEACQFSLNRRGITLSESEIASNLGMVEEYFQNFLDIDEVEGAIADAVIYVKEKLPSVELYPDALEVLEDLHNNGKRLALITSSYHEYIADILEKYDLLKLFDTIIAHDDVEHLKPHPEPLEKAITALKGVHAETVMIGDSVSDLGAALNTGVDSILFYPPEHAKFHDLEELKKLKPTYIIRDFREILDIV